jgi:hypothetical protein
MVKIFQENPIPKIHHLILATKAPGHKETQRGFILGIKKILSLCPLVSLCLGGKEKIRKWRWIFGINGS